jgi:hypothetical protein
MKILQTKEQIVFFLYKQKNIWDPLFNFLKLLAGCGMHFIMYQ